MPETGKKAQLGAQPQAITGSPACFEIHQQEAAPGGSGDPTASGTSSPHGAHSQARLRPLSPLEPPSGKTTSIQACRGGPRAPGEAGGPAPRRRLPWGPTCGANNGHTQPAGHTVTFCRLPCLPPGSQGPWTDLQFLNRPPPFGSVQQPLPDLSPEPGSALAAAPEGEAPPPAC